MIARTLSELAAKHLGTRQDLVAWQLAHDTADEIAQPLGEVRDWRAGECEAGAGQDDAQVLVVERDYTAVADKMTAWSAGQVSERS